MDSRRAPKACQQVVGARLRKLRKSRGLRVCDVSRALDMSDHNWLWYEQGRNTLRASLLRPIAETLDMDACELFEQLYPPSECG